MALKSSFKVDLKKERLLSVLLDAYYKSALKQYDFERISSIEQQLAGIDLILTHKKSRQSFTVDEKAQLDYVNDDLPTFAFEISYRKSGVSKKGWLFDTTKKTDFYALITGIYSDEPGVYTSCKITMVNRKKLLSFLSDRSIDLTLLQAYIKNHLQHQGKVALKELHDPSEGYLYFSTRNKAEKPVNLILKLDFLITEGIAKRLV